MQKKILAAIVLVAGATVASISIGNAQGEAETTALESQIDKLSAQIAELAASVTSLNQEIASLNTGVGEGNAASTPAIRAFYNRKQLADLGLPTSCASEGCAATADQICSSLGQTKATRFHTYPGYVPDIEEPQSTEFQAVLCE